MYDEETGRSHNMNVCTILRQYNMKIRNEKPTTKQNISGFKI
jgi:hypothetical protein